MSNQASPTDRDVALLKAVGQGDLKGLSELYRRHKDRLLVQARRLLKCDAEAEDLVQDLFFALGRCAPTFDPDRGCVGSWLALRLRSMGLDRLRTVRLRRAVMERKFPQALSSESIDYERFQLQRAVENLPHTQALVMTLTYGFGMTGREIAATLALPEGTVRSRLASALGALSASAKVVVKGPRRKTRHGRMTLDRRTHQQPPSDVRQSTTKQMESLETLVA